MRLITRIRKGVAAVRMANETNELNENRIKILIDRFNKSDELSWMKIGDRYYKVENDIVELKSKTGNDKYRADNRLAHAKYKDQVDEKVSYLLSKPYTLKCADEEYLENVKQVLGDDFQYVLYRLGYESTNKGKGWLHPYINPEGNLKFMIIPAEQCIPLWKDIEHKEVDDMIRFYAEEVWQGDTRKQVTAVEQWSGNGVKYYRKDGNLMIFDPIRNLSDNGTTINHYQLDGEETAWGKVPFVSFKNNFKELPDIKFIKSLIDNYDKSRSDAANYVEDVTNFIIAVYGYNPSQAQQLKRMIKEHGMMFFDEKDDDGAEIMTPQTDVTSVKEHWEQLKRDIIEEGQSVNRDPDKLGSAPSGIALQMLYSSLELKTSAMAIEYQQAFEQLMYFVNKYLEMKNMKVSDEKISIVFNVDMKTDEAQTIQNCKNSKGIISDRTILANHPWVEDALEEKELLEQEALEHPFNDKVPGIEDVIDDE